MYGFPLDWMLPRGAPEPARGPRPAAGRARCAAGWASGTPRSTWPRPAWSSTPDPRPATQRYRDWIAEYVGAWRERAAANGGVIPDNVAPGRHGRRPAGGPLVRRPLRLVLAARLVQRRARRDRRRAGRRRRHRRRLLPGPGAARRWTRSSPTARSWPSPRPTPASSPSGPSSSARTCTRPTLHVPFRHDDRGWFDYNPMLMARARPRCGTTPPPPPTGSASSGCARPPATTGARCGPSAARRRPGTRSPGSPSSPATTPDYPERILAAAQAQVRHRLARMERYRGRDVPEADIHLWQQSNPVVTEALVQLTWGGPQVVYNGGLQQARVRYYDADARRPGLPAVGRGPGLQHRPGGHRRRPGQPRPRSRPRSVIVQAGAFAEHTIRAVRAHRLRRPVLDRRPVRLRHTAPEVTHADVEVRRSAG